MKQQTSKNWTKTVSFYKSVDGHRIKENAVLSSSQKGIAFENFIVSKFSNPHFSIVDWRSDKYYNGVYPETSKMPDLIVGLKTKYFRDTFLVECKWRQYLPFGKLILKDYQLKNYKRYEQETGKTVFIVLGLGGTPGNPESVYIVPLHEIYSAELTQSQLSQYQRQRKGNFYLDTPSMVLN